MSQEIADARTHGLWVRASVMCGPARPSSPSVVGGVVVSVRAAGLGASDGEVLADLDGELVAVGGGDVGFVGAAVVGLAALDGGAGVGGQHGGLDLGLGVPGQRFLALTAATVVAGAVAAGLGASDGEVLADQDGELVAVGGGDVGFVDAALVGLAALDGGAGVGRQHCGLHLRLGVPGQRLLVRRRARRRPRRTGLLGVRADRAGEDTAGDQAGG